MAKRYIPRSPFTAPDKKGRKRWFHPDRKGKDGTLGYTEAEVDGLYKETLKSFKIETVSGDSVIEKDDEEVVERATAAPGEKRTTKTKATSK